MTKKEPISKRIYLDYAATTPVDTEVFGIMKPFLEWGSIFGNPGSLHSFGRESLKHIDEARTKIAKSIGANFNEVVFTGSATEANNLALRGVVRKWQMANSESMNHKQLAINKPKIIISAIEHESVFETAKDLEKEGIEVAIIPVDKNGIIDLKKLEKELDERTILVSVMYANNEIGTVQDIYKIGKIISDFRKQIANSKSRHLPFATGYWPLFHTDAVQAFQFLDCDVKKLGVDLMTLSAHKIYGPKGVGLLYRRITNFKLPISNKFRMNNLSNTEKTLIPSSKGGSALGGNPYTLIPILTGGGQEFGLRSGTENVAGIAGFARAVKLVSNSRELENKRISGLKKVLWNEIKKIYPKAEVNGSTKNTLPNILNIYFPNISSELLLIKLDMEGVAVSSGSACHARSQEPSRVIQDIWGEKRARESIRFSLGKYTTEEKIQRAGVIIKKVLDKLN